jgi:hypothetical protein
MSPGFEEETDAFPAIDADGNLCMICVLTEVRPRQSQEAAGPRRLGASRFTTLAGEAIIPDGDNFRFVISGKTLTRLTAEEYFAFLANAGKEPPPPGTTEHTSVTSEIRKWIDS